MVAGDAAVETERREDRRNRLREDGEEEERGAGEGEEEEAGRAGDEEEELAGDGQLEEDETLQLAIVLLHEGVSHVRLGRRIYEGKRAIGEIRRVAVKAYVVLGVLDVGALGEGMDFGQVPTRDSHGGGVGVPKGRERRERGQDNSSKGNMRWPCTRNQ